MTYKFVPYPKNQASFSDLHKQVFGRWTVLGYLGDGHWLCICECGYVASQKASDLKQGKTTGCRDCQHANAKGYRIDLTGQTFGRLTVASYSGNSEWLCVCECGNVVTVSGSSLRSANTKSCGCLTREYTIARNKANAGKAMHIKHGRHNTREYHSWQAMKQRCKDKTDMRYGGRGISVHQDWIDSFEVFLADMGPCPEGYSLDRINPDGNYEPTNCRWADKTTQASNRNATTVIEFNGVSDSVAGWARRIGISPMALTTRLRKWPLERALTSPKLDRQGKVVSQ